MAEYTSNLDDTLTEDEQQFVAQLDTDRTWALNYYSTRNIEFERMFSWFSKQHYGTEAEVPADGIMDEATDESEHLTVIPIPTNIINSVHGMLTDDDFYIQCISASGRKSTDKATGTERFLHGTYWINRQTHGGDPWEDAALDALIYGWGCVYSYWDVDRAQLARSSKGRPKDILDFYSYPIVVKRVHPQDIYPLPHGVRERWRGVMQIVNRTVREVEEEWGVALEPKMQFDDDGSPALDPDNNILYEELNDDSLVEYIDYWVWRRDKETNDPDVLDWQLWHCVYANNQTVKKPTPMPEYEMLPYEIFFCRKTPSDAGSHLGLSFLYPIIEPVQEMEYLVNRQSRMIEMYADPMLAVIDAAGGQDQDIEKGPGTTLYLNPGGDAKWITWAGNSPDISQLLRLWRETAQDAFPPVMTGLVGGTSGLDTIALQQGGKLQTNKPRRNLELAIQRVNTKVIRLLQKFSYDDPLYVIGQRPEGDEEVPFAFPIKGKDTRGFENTIVTVRGRFPQEELRNVVVATQAVGAGLMSQRRASGKYLYVQDPEEEFKLIMQEQMMKNPTWLQIFQQMYMSLPARSPVSQALTPPSDATAPSADTGMANDMAGGIAASSMATTPSEVQRGVQTTPVESNAFSALAGGPPPFAPQ